MKLNPDCIRDILEVIENVTTPTSFFEFDYDEPVEPPLDKYSHETFLYHIRQCYLSGLIVDLREFDGGNSGIVTDLTPDGHEFLANIRTDTVWKKLKEKGISSIPFLLEFARDFALAYYQNNSQ